MPEPPHPPVAPEVIEEKVEGGTRVIIPQQEFFVPDNIEEVEAIADAMAAKAEIMAERVEIIAEQQEALAAQIELKVTSIMTEEFEAEMENASEVVSDLADQCMDEAFSNDIRVIISSQNSRGETFRALCIKGDARELYSSETEAFVAESDLSAEERQRFYEDRDATIKFKN